MCCRNYMLVNQPTGTWLHVDQWGELVATSNNPSVFAENEAHAAASLAQQIYARKFDLIEVQKIELPTRRRTRVRLVVPVTAKGSTYLSLHRSAEDRNRGHLDAYWLKAGAPARSGAANDSFHRAPFGPSRRRT